MMPLTPTMPAAHRKPITNWMRQPLNVAGSLSGEHGGGCLKEVGKQLGQKEHALMLRVRRVFDPSGILNPGKGY